VEQLLQAPCIAGIQVNQVRKLMQRRLAPTCLTSRLQSEQIVASKMDMAHNLIVIIWRHGGTGIEGPTTTAKSGLSNLNNPHQVDHF
jgi:hypothetical protein